MFTGIIDHCGTIVKIESIPSGLTLSIKTHLTSLELGESIAINGICLTITAINNDIFCCDISPESLNTTTAKEFKLNQLVNLERALQLSSRIGGHFVSGHIDQICWIKNIRPMGGFTEITFTGLDETSRGYVIKKGSLAVNGVSLTINEVRDQEFSVMIIPHTLERTQLAQLREKDAVNIEFDMMARIVAEQAKLYK